MSTRLFLLLSIILAFLQGSLLPSVLFEGILVLLYVLVTRFSKAIVFVFITGLIFDLVQGQPLGLTSLIFLFYAGFVRLLRGELPLQRPIYLAFTVVIFSLIRARVMFGDYYVISGVFAFFFSLTIFTLFWKPEVAGKIKI